MPYEVIMPKVDMDMAQGKLAVWHVAEGQMVTKGAPLFDIETDKAAMEVEAPATGRLHHILAAPGQTMPVGAALAFLYAEGEAVGPAPTAAAAAPAAAPAVAATAEPVATVAPAAPAPLAAPAPVPAPIVEIQGPRATPVARRMARDAAIALDNLIGSGPRQRIQKQDVERELARRAARVAAAVAAPAPVAPPAPLASPAVAQAGDLSVKTRPGTGTPLFMIHGFAADSSGWMALERALPRDLPLIRVDLPGHGRSARRAIRDFGELLRSIVQVFDAHVEGPAHVLGHSLGGALALGLTDIRPRQVRTLNLIAPAGLGPEIDGAALMGIARAAQVESLAPWLKRLTARPDGISHDYARAAMLARNDQALRDAQVDLAQVLFPDGVQGFDLTAALERLSAPTAMIWGREDHILPWKHALTAPGEVALHLLRGVGHMPHMEDPETVAALIRRNIGA